MSAGLILERASSILAERDATYGDASTAMAAIAARWSLTLGHAVTPAQVALCMIDLKLTRLARDPNYQDGPVDLIGYAAILAELQR